MLKGSQPSSWVFLVSSHGCFTHQDRKLSEAWKCIYAQPEQVQVAVSTEVKRRLSRCRYLSLVITARLRCRKSHVYNLASPALLYMCHNESAYYSHVRIDMCMVNDKSQMEKHRVRQLPILFLPIKVS